MQSNPLDKRSQSSPLITRGMTAAAKKACRFELEPDELLLCQQFTYPIASRAVDTDVLDTTKEIGLTAVNFGDRFTSPIVALMVDSKNDFESIAWKFRAAKENTKMA